MIVRLHLLLVLLAAVARAGGVLVPHNSTHNREPTPPVPSETHGHSTADSHVTHVRTTTRPIPKIATTEATSLAELPPLPTNNFTFTTDAATSPHYITLPINEHMPSLHFWSHANSTSINVTFISATTYYTRTMVTVLPRHWHSIDIYQPVEQYNYIVHLTFNMDQGVTIRMDTSSLLQIQTKSEDLVHWRFCPNNRQCALAATAEEPTEKNTYSSGERVGLVAALVVVVVLLVASLVTLAVVTFYRKSELFHIYAKPETNNSFEYIPITSSSPTLTLIKFSTNTTTEAKLHACNSKRICYQAESFVIQQDDKRNIIYVLYARQINEDYFGFMMKNRLTGKSISTHFHEETVHAAVGSAKPVRWQIFDDDATNLTTSTAGLSASTRNTSLASTSPLSYQTPTFLTLASLCALLALSTIVLSVLQCRRCAFARNGRGHAPSISHSTIVWSTESISDQHVNLPNKYIDQGSLHISENSLYGVL